MHDFDNYQVALLVQLFNGKKAVRWTVTGYDFPTAEGKNPAEVILAGAVVDTETSWINLRDTAKNHAEDFIDAYRSFCTTYDYRS